MMTNRYLGSISKGKPTEGDVEVHTSNGEEVELQKRLDLSGCRKNPGHRDFFPLESFSKEKLPRKYREDDTLFSCILTIAKLTVCLKVSLVSDQRPTVCPFSSEPYPFSDARGRNFLRVGSGWIENVEQISGSKARRRKKKKCPCAECKKSENPSKIWGRIHIVTASHLCFDTKEALHTKCQLDYDSEKDRNSTVLDGVKAISNDTHDATVFTCATHDLKLTNDLKKLCQKRQKCLEKLQSSRKYNDNETARREHRLAVIVSHPHGLCKHITVGEWVDREEEGGLFRYTYTTPTCQGSSGAPVFILGRKHYWSSQCHSRRCQQEGYNMSGYCSEGKELEKLLHIKV